MYVDGIPSNLLKLLVEFEKEKVIKSGTKIYCIVNNGFYEGKQNRLAILQMKNWCEKVKADWGQGIGVGAGELLPYLKKYLAVTLKKTSAIIKNITSTQA